MSGDQDLGVLTLGSATTSEFCVCMSDLMNAIRWPSGDQPIPDRTPFPRSERRGAAEERHANHAGLVGRPGLDFEHVDVTAVGRDGGA